MSFGREKLTHARLGFHRNVETLRNRKQKDVEFLAQAGAQYNTEISVVLTCVIYTARAVTQLCLAAPRGAASQKRHTESDDCCRQCDRPFDARINIEAC